MWLDVRDASSIPRLGRSLGGGHSNPPQYSCLENPRDGGAWWASVYGVTQSWTRLKRLSSSSKDSNHPIKRAQWWNPVSWTLAAAYIPAWVLLCPSFPSSRHLTSSANFPSYNLLLASDSTLLFSTNNQFLSYSWVFCSPDLLYCYCFCLFSLLNYSMKSPVV